MLDLQKRCKNSTESAHTPLTQFVSPCQNYKINIGMLLLAKLQIHILLDLFH